MKILPPSVFRVVAIPPAVHAGIAVCLLFALSLRIGFAQQQFQDKCSPTLRAQLALSASTAKQVQLYSVIVSDLPAFRRWAMEEGLRIHGIYAPAGAVVFEDRVSHFVQQVLLRPEVLFADRAYRSAAEEFAVPGHNLFLNRIRYVHQRFPQYDGSGQAISIKEYRFDSSDVDLRMRVLPYPGASTQQRVHASIMATLAAGAGNSLPAGRGVARGSLLLSSDFTNLFPDADSVYQQYGLNVQNHSYGIDIENYYGASALAYDLNSLRFPGLVHVFSAGNSGLSASSTGTYAGISTYATLTGNFKMAKNVLTVGATDSFGQVMPFSSAGPAYDGRLKPDLVAFGQDGASGAAALVSGAAAVLHQAYQARFSKTAHAATIRAALCISARDKGTAGPDYRYGHGQLDLAAALRVVQSHFVEQDTLKRDSAKIYRIEVPAGADEIKACVAWNDPPAAALAPRALLNDLDLRLYAPGGKAWLPWVNNSFPHPDSLALLAQRGRDSLNNLEIVQVPNPGPGQWELHVSASAMQGEKQDFAILCSWTAAEQLTWISPVAGEPVQPGKRFVLQWESSLSADDAALYWRPAGQSTWRIIEATLNLQTGLYKWRVPDTFAVAQLRIETATGIFDSDSFLIAPELRMNIGFDCADSLQLYWKPLPEGAHYTVWALDTRYLQPKFQTQRSDTVLFKRNDTQTRFAVSAGTLIPAAQAPPGGSQLLGATGLGCYVNNLLAFLEAGERVYLSLELGSNYGIQHVFLEKQHAGGWIELADFQPDSLLFVHVDQHPQSGPNRYRARLLMHNGADIFSEIQTVYYGGPEGYTVYPNPLQSGATLTCLSTGFADVPQISLFDATGRVLLTRGLVTEKELIQLSKLAPGYYMWRITDEQAKLLARGKLLIQP